MNQIGEDAGGVGNALLSTSKTSVSFGGYVYSFEDDSLVDPAGQAVRLRAQSMAVLRVLAGRSGRIVSKQTLHETVWPQAVVTDDSLIQCIADIRRGLGEVGHLVLQTKPRRGYVLVPDGPAWPEASKISVESDDFSQHVGNVISGDGTRITYAVAGEGTPVLRMPHWLNCLSVDWRNPVTAPAIRNLSKAFALVRFDCRGAGVSERSVPPGCSTDWALDAKAVADATIEGRFGLIGISAGGMSALRFAADYPERVSCLVLYGAFARGHLTDWQTRANLDAAMRLVEDGWASGNDAIRQMMTSQFFLNATREQMDAFNELQRAACSPEHAALLLEMAAVDDASDALLRVRVPTLVIHALGDVRKSFAGAREIADAIPGARLEPIEGVDHLALRGSPEAPRVHRLIVDFIREHADPDSRTYLSTNTS